VKKTGSGPAKKKAKASPGLDPLQTGMPSLDSVTGVEEFKKGKKVLRVIHTTEADAYDPVAPKRKK
jgi:hypothetical protein